MRKLGFEETPDYDFLRELFTKVLKNAGEPEDGVYDWMLLNNGKGWEAGVRASRLKSSFKDADMLHLARSQARCSLRRASRRTTRRANTARSRETGTASASARSATPPVQQQQRPRREGSPA